MAHGKKDNQKLKSLLVWNELCRETDEEFFLSAEAIAEALKEKGIDAERRSIYRDIEQLNKIMYMIENGCSLEEAETALEEDFENAAIIRYAKKKGYYVVHQNYELDDIRLIAECIYSARFVDNTHLSQLLDVISHLVSENQAEKIRSASLNVDRTRTTNDDTFFHIGTINDAMSVRLAQKAHTPEKIKFRYVKYTISNTNQSLVEAPGKNIVVSPYKLIISDGNYYLHAFDDGAQEMRMYRVDRMRDVRRTGIPREGKEIAERIDYSGYTKRVFSMFGGPKENVILQFTMSLLSTVVEKFGYDTAQYHKIDAHHFSITTNVEISPQFFGWMCGLGPGALIVEPQNIKEQYKEYLEKIIKRMK